MFHTVLENGKPYSFRPQKNLKLSMASLDAEKSPADIIFPILIEIENTNAPVLLCTLSKSLRVLQAELKFNIPKATNVTIFIKGQCTIHLSGSYFEKEINEWNQNAISYKEHEKYLLKNEIQESNTKLSKEIKEHLYSLKRDILNLKGEISSIRGNRYALETENESLNEKLSLSATQLESLKNEIEELKTKNKETKMKLLVSQEVNEELTKEISSIRGNRYALETENESLNEKLSLSATQLESLKNEIEELKTKNKETEMKLLVSQEVNNEQLTKDKLILIKSLKVNIDALETENESLNEKLSLSATQLESLKNEVEELKTKNKASSNAAPSFHKSVAAVDNYYSSSSYNAAATPVSSASANVYYGMVNGKQFVEQFKSVPVQSRFQRRPPILYPISKLRQ